MKKILVTGSAGGVGTCFREFAADRYEFVCFDRQPTKGVPDAVVAELTDLEALKKAARGCQAVLHLGAYAVDGNFMQKLLPSNLVGTFNAYEAARAEGIKKFVFASSEQVNLGWRLAGATIKPDMHRFPTNHYGASKCFGEDLGKVYSLKHNMSVICLRFGWVLIPSKTKGIIKHSGGHVPDYAITAKDTNEIIAHALEVEGRSFEALNCFSLNAAGFCDLSGIKDVLGYGPIEDAIEMYAKGTLPGT